MGCRVFTYSTFSKRNYLFLVYFLQAWISCYRLQMIYTPPTMKIKVILIWNQSCSPWSYDNDNNDKIIMTIMMRLSDNNLPRQLGPDSPQTDHLLSYIPTLVSSQAIWKCFQDNCMYVLSIQSSLLHTTMTQTYGSKQQIATNPPIPFNFLSVFQNYQ